MTQTAVVLLGAAAFSIWLLLDQNMQSGAPLAGTLAIAPLVLALLFASSRLFKSEPPRHSGPRLFAAGLLLVLALVSGSLGLTWGRDLGAVALLAGLYGLLFWQAVGQLLVAAPEALVKRRTSLGLAALVLAVYLAIMPWSTTQRPPDGDEPWYLLITHSLAYDLDTDLKNNYEQKDSLSFMPREIGPQTGDPVGPGGEAYSRHNAALPIVLAPAYRLAGKAGALVLMALMTTCLVVLIYRLADFYFPAHPRESLLAAGLSGLSPPILLYSHQVWAEVPAALLTCLACWSLLQVTSRRTTRSIYGVALLSSIALLPMLKLRFAAVAAGLVFFAAVRLPSEQRRFAVRAGIGLLGLFAGFLIFNELSFGDPFKYHGDRTLFVYLSASPFEYLSAPRALYFDSAFGLLLSAPIWALLWSLPAVGWAAVRRLVRDAALVCGPYLLLLGPRGGWTGGWTPPFRYGMVLLPFLALFLVPVLALDSRRQRMFTGFLAAATACLLLVWILIPGWTYNFANGRTYLLDSLSLSLGTDVARFFPSLIRWRAANYAWFGAALSWMVLAWMPSRHPAKKHHSGWGIAGFCLTLALLPLLATHWPQTIVEFEDPYVSSLGGKPYPNRWAPNRKGLRGSWELEAGNSVSVEVQPKKPKLGLDIDYLRSRANQPARLEILAGTTPVWAASLPPAAGWNTLKVEPIAWPEETLLSFRLSNGSSGSLLLDRACLRWQD